MTESTDVPSDSPTAREVVARASHEGIAVRKVATMHGSDAVAVYFSIRSIREDRCTVRVADAIPEPLRGHEVEFHPKYDPVNWTLADGTAVYAATIPADSSRTTVYGVVVDDPGQLQLFTAEPAVEITDSERTGGGGFSFESDDPAPADASRDEDGGSVMSDRTPGAEQSQTESVEDRPAADEEPYGSYFDEPDIDVDGSEDFGLRPDRSTEPARGSVVDELVSAARAGELTEEDQQALREGLGLEDPDSARSRLEAIREEVEALREEVAAGDRRAAEIDRLEDRLETLSRTVDDRYRSLAGDLEELEDAVAREARWRSQLRDSLEFDPEPSSPRSWDEERE